MKNLATTFAALVLASALTVSTAEAGPSVDALAACLADGTNGKDRKDMARWVFVVMSIHPEIAKLSNVKPADREELDKTLAGLFTRLMTENCPTQAKAAMEAEGAPGFQAAFSVIGKLAMQELLSDPSVSSSFTSFSKHIDNNKIQSVFSKK